MQLDWFTLVAQLVNFLILLFLLQRLLYKPIINAMAERQVRIEAQVGEAKEYEEGAQKLLARYQQDLEDLENEREKLLGQAHAEAETAKHNLIQLARAEIDELRSQWHSALIQEKGAFLQNLKLRAGEEIYQTIRKAFADLADEELERHIAKLFLRQLGTLTGSERERIARALERARGNVDVSSAFALDARTRESLRRAVQDIAGAGVTPAMNFRVVPDLICGIELSTYDQKVAWNVDGYLSGLEAEVVKHLDGRAQLPASQEVGAA